MTTSAPPSYAGYRFPAEIISFAVGLCFRFPLSLRHVDEILAARGIAISHETVRQCGLQFGQAFANQSRPAIRQSPGCELGGEVAAGAVAGEAGDARILFGNE